MIFYFSATGNCLQVAEILARSTDDRISDITEELKGDCIYDLAEGEKVGIVCPVYFYGLPLNIEEFISKMSFDRSHFTYLVLTYGTFPGDAMGKAEKSMNENGYELSGKLTVRMPENYVLLFNPPSASEVKTIIKEAESRIDGFSRSISKGEKADMTDNKNIWYNIVGAIARPIYTYGRGTGRFYADVKCIKCGKCADMCPSNAIEFVDRIPTWTKNKCLRCNACINRCPEGAIQFGHSTRKRRRYINPVTKDRL